MSSISLVMIVKNEEKTLPACLGSVSGLVDEYVIVDTGSTDGTPDLIRQYGPLYQDTFTTFGETKNRAIERATGDYILVMDADERIIRGGERLREYAERGVDAVAALIVEGDPDSPINQYFRVRMAKKTWRFVGDVHEVLSGDGEIIFDRQIVVHHDHSHRDQASYSERFQRYLEILSQKDDPRSLFYLARTYKDLGRYWEAIGAYTRYLRSGSNFRDEQWQAAYDIALCYYFLSEYRHALNWLENARKIDPRRAEADVLRGEIFYLLEEYEEAAKSFEAAIRPIPEDVILFLNPMAYGDLPRDWLTVTYSKLHDYRSALRHCELISVKHKDQRFVNNLSFLRSKCHLRFAFCLGDTPEPIWGSVLYDRGAGGLETTYIELPTELAKLGHEVFVFGRCHPHVHQGVWYLPYDQENPLEYNPDVIVTSRWYDVINPERPTILWLQDAILFGSKDQIRFGDVKLIVVSSRWHYGHVLTQFSGLVKKETIRIIPLSVRKELYDQRVPRIPTQCIYTSSPDRGLEILADLWPRIKQKVSDANLVVTYGWNSIENWSAPESWKEKIREQKKKILEKLPDAHFTGRLPKHELARVQLSSGVCLYPCNFWETFCLSGLELQMAGVPIITSHIGALDTTLGEGNIMIDDMPPTDPAYQEVFVEAAVRLLRDPKERDWRGMLVRRYAESFPTWADVARMWESLVWEVL
jgi:glycosyltransferase involved in cell wall biosynthesis